MRPGKMRGCKGKPIRGILLAAGMLTLFVASSISADGNALRAQAKQGNVEAQLLLGAMYAKGRGVPQDDAESARWVRMAAEQGDARAQLLLGAIYVKGQGLPQDSVESAKWVRKAAEQGGAKAQRILGAMYGKGQGVPQDSAESARWVRMAAEQGDARAQLFLGAMYGKGQGVPRDYVQSCFWSGLSVSSASGKEYQDALEARDRAAKELTPEEIVKVQRMTREWENTHPR